MNKKVLAIVGGGCLLVLLCAVCVAGAYFYVYPQIAAQYGAVSALGNPNPTPDTSTLGGATAQPLPTTAPNVPSQPSAPQTSNSNPADVVAKAFQSWGGVKSFRAHMTTSAGGAGAQDIEIEVVTPDRLHITMKGAEMIMISNTTYVKVGNTWQKMTLPQSVPLDLIDPKKFQAGLGNLPDIKLVGPEVLDGTPTLVFQVSSTTGGTTQPVKIWVGATDGMPRKIVTAGATITFSDFNSNIAINAPIP